MDKYTNLTKSDDLDTRKSKLKNLSMKLINKRVSISMEDISLRNSKFDQIYFHRRSSSESITSSFSSLSDELIFPINHQQFSPRKIKFNLKFWKINHKIYTIDETPEILSIRFIDSKRPKTERNDQIERVISRSNRLRPLSRRTINKSRKIKNDSENIELTEMESKTTNCTSKQNKTFLSCISFRHVKTLFGCKNLKIKKYIKIQ